MCLMTVLFSNVSSPLIITRFLKHLPQYAFLYAYVFRWRPFILYSVLLMCFINPCLLLSAVFLGCFGKAYLVGHVEVFRQNISCHFPLCTLKYDGTVT